MAVRLGEVMIFVKHYDPRAGTLQYVNHVLLHPALSLAKLADALSDKRSLPVDRVKVLVFVTGSLLKLLILHESGRRTCPGTGDKMNNCSARHCAVACGCTGLSAQPSKTWPVCCAHC